MRRKGEAIDVAELGVPPPARGAPASSSQQQQRVWSASMQRTLNALANDLERGAELVVSDESDDSFDEERLDAEFFGEEGTLRSRLSSTASDIIAESFQEDLPSAGGKRRNTWWRILMSVLQACLVITLIVAAVYFFEEMFPDLNSQIKDWANWADSVGTWGTAAFILFAGILLMIPGVPGSLLCFSCGAVFGFIKGVFVAGTAHHIGACFAFLFARKLCKSRFERMLLTRPTLKNISLAASFEQWKVTFLSRFIVMPVQIKNYLFGVLPVTFKCFFTMAFLGDFQSTLATVYIGSVSSSILENAGDSENTKNSWLSMFSLFTAILMTTIASIVARRAYTRVIADLKTSSFSNNGSSQVVRRRSRRTLSSFRSIPEGDAGLARRRSAEDDILISPRSN